MEKYLKISEFAAVTGISRKLLIFYDNNGILHPQYTDPENGYRYYSYHQIDTAYVILTFREAGMSLDDIRQYLSSRSPEHLLEALDIQEASLDRQIWKLQQIKGMVQARRLQTQEGMGVTVGKISEREFQSENLFLGEEFPEDHTLKDGWKHLPAFYDACAKKGIQLGLAIGTVVDYQNLKEGLWEKPSRFFYRLPPGQYPNYFVTPAGLYVVGSIYADYGHPGLLYESMFSYISKHHLEICGNAYEEYLIDEIAEKNPDRYLLQILIQVKRLN